MTTHSQPLRMACATGSGWPAAAAPRSPLQRQAFDTRAESAFVMDQDDSTVLCQKCRNAAPPASMSKLMTLDMCFGGAGAGHGDHGQTFPGSRRGHVQWAGRPCFLNDKITPSVRRN